MLGTGRDGNTGPGRLPRQWARSRLTAGRGLVAGLSLRDRPRILGFGRFTVGQVAFTRSLIRPVVLVEERRGIVIVHSGLVVAFRRLHHVWTHAGAGDSRGRIAVAAVGPGRMAIPASCA